MINNKPELLAPAGSYESVMAAVRSGADAVYIGAKQFSARASAQNFDEEELTRAVRYCHARGVKVYLALNTLVTDSELEPALNIVKEACSLPIDAVIVQDTGLASFIKKCCPQLKLHASTQMSVHTPQGARFLYEQGFSRVVLSRELSREEIKQIAKSCPIELEVFVHGALCMSVSGQCYFSSVLGGRSGNRGQCAQPCRLPFCAENGTGYDLSLKDLSLLNYLGELKEAGVHSFKIEGRMKRPEYVAATVSAAKKALTNGFLPSEEKAFLEQVFSRSGFTDGYYKEELGRGMFGVRSKENVQSATNALLSQIRTQYKDEKQSVPVSFVLKVKKSESVSLTVSDGNAHTVTVQGEPPQDALSVPISVKKCIGQLEKTGGTPFLCTDVICDIGENLSLPLSALNKLRREALNKLEENRSCRSPLQFTTIELANTEKHSAHGPKPLRARFSDTDIPDCFKQCELVYVPLYTPEKELTRLMNNGYAAAVEIPRGMFGREESIKKLLQKAKDCGVTHALAQNIGAIPLAHELGFTIHGGFALGVMNSMSLDWAQKIGLCDTELSIELNCAQINALSGSVPRGIFAYGRLPLMLTRNCPAKNGGKCGSCNRDRFIIDRKHEKFPLICDYNCTEVLNCVPLNVLDRIDEFTGADFAVMRFSVENHVEKEESFRLFQEKTRMNTPFTRGLYYRTVF